MARSLWVKMLVSNAEMGGATELIMDVSLVHVHDLTGNAADPADRRAGFGAREREQPSVRTRSREGGERETQKPAGPTPTSPNDFVEHILLLRHGTQYAGGGCWHGHLGAVRDKRARSCVLDQISKILHIPRMLLPEWLRVWCCAIDSLCLHRRARERRQQSQE